jgi:hypothetical protein
MLFDEDGQMLEEPSDEPESLGVVAALLGGWLLGQEYFFTIAGAEFDNAPPSSEVLELLSKLPKVYALSFRATGISADALEQIKRLPGLQSISIEDVNDEVLLELSSLTNLRSLHVRGDGLTDTGVAHVGRLENLRELGIGGNKLTDAALAELTRLKHLRKLHLSRTGLTQESLVPISRIENLENLSLAGFSADPDLSPLRDLRKLRLLDLHDVNVAWRTLGDLRRFLPDMETATRGSNARGGWCCHIPSERAREAYRTARAASKKQ